MSANDWGSWATGDEDLSGYSAPGDEGYGWISNVMQHQNRTNWCWAAIGVSVGLWYRGIGPFTSIPSGVCAVQCQLIQAATDPHNYYKCCTLLGSETSCNYTGRVNVALMTAGVTPGAVDFDYRALPTWDMVQSYIDGTGRTFTGVHPFVCVYSYRGLHGQVNHALAVWATFSSHWVRLEDPASGPTYMCWDDFPGDYKRNAYASWEIGWTTSTLSEHADRPPPRKSKP